MKKLLKNILFIMVIFLGFQINAKAVYVSFNSTDTTDGSTKIGYMEGVSLRNGVMNLVIQDSNANDGIDPNNMTREGYVFAGWVEHQPTPNDNVLTIDNVNKTISYSANNDGNPRNVYATWDLEYYDINLDIADGTSTNPQTYTIEDNDIEIVAPTREGYEFVGWSDATGADLGMTYTIRAGSTGDVNLTANWEAIEYSINYDLNGGELDEENPAGYTIESPDITLNNPSKEGYEFEGWTGSNGDTPEETVTITNGSTEDREYTANFTPAVYVITYNLQDGEVSGNPDSYTIESDEITLINPTKEGYEFIGWEGTGLTEPTMVVTIPAGSIGDRRYIAMWKEIESSETTGVGGSDIDSKNPQTNDDVVIYISLLGLSSLGIITTRKRLYN